MVNLISSCKCVCLVKMIGFRVYTGVVGLSIGVDCSDYKWSSTVPSGGIDGTWSGDSVMYTFCWRLATLPLISPFHINANEIATNANTDELNNCTCCLSHDCRQTCTGHACDPQEILRLLTAQWTVMLQTQVVVNTFTTPKGEVRRKRRDTGVSYEFFLFFPTPLNPALCPKGSL